MFARDRDSKSRAEEFVSVLSGMYSGFSFLVATLTQCPLRLSDSALRLCIGLYMRRDGEAIMSPSSWNLALVMYLALSPLLAHNYVSTNQCTSIGLELLARLLSHAG